MSDVKKKFINHATVAAYLGVIVEKMRKDNFTPDLVVGLSRGGLIPGAMMSHFMNVPFIPFQTALRDHPVWKPNKADLADAKTVVIIDDICDTGATFKKLKAELNEQLIINYILSNKNILNKNAISEKFDSKNSSFIVIPSKVVDFDANQYFCCDKHRMILSSDNFALCSFKSAS